MNKQRLAILITGVLGALGSFLPWVSVLGMSVSGINGDGQLTLILMLPAIILSLVGDRKQNLTGAKLYSSIIPALLACAIAIWKISEIPMGLGIGLIITAIAPIALTASAFLIKDNK